MFLNTINKKISTMILLSVFLFLFVATNANAATTISTNITTGGTLTVSGNASLGTVNGNTITTGTGVLTLGAGKTLTVSNTLTLAGTDSSTLNIGAGGTLGTGAFATIASYQTVLTNSAGLLAALSDETGTGLSVFNNSPTFLDDITIGTVGTATGQIKIKGTTSGTVTVQTADAAGTYTLTLPTDDGTTSQFLQTNGSGVLTWATGNSGTVTSVGVVAPIGLTVSGSPITSSGNMTLAFDIEPTFIPFGSGTRTMATSTALYYTSGTGTLNATTFVGALTGNADTVTGLSVTGGQTLTVTTGGTLGTGAYATIANYATLADPVFTGSLAIPQGASPTVDAVGEMAFDTTDNQLLIATSTTPVVIRTTNKIFSFTLASTSPEFFNGGSLPVPPETDGYTITSYSCYVTGGTSVVFTPSDGTNDMDAITCAATITSDTNISANPIATAGELMKVKVGAITGVVNYVSFSAFGTWTRE
ncbi:MAG: hypothetical protein AAB334_01180 [Patescibacteria group bacterium]|mgnify:CR=1 FL=1